MSETAMDSKELTQRLAQFNEMLSYRDHLDCFNGIKNNTLLTRVTECIDNVYTTLCNGYRRDVREGLRNEKLVGDLEKILVNTTLSEKIIEPLSRLLADNSYRYAYQTRFPQLWDEIIHPKVLERLLDTGSLQYKVLVLLAEYGHKYFFDRSPVLLRIRAPHTKGESLTRHGNKKGKDPVVPQEDYVCFVYNGQQALSGETALVSVDGKEFIEVPKHNRVTILRKPGVVKQALQTGLYNSKGKTLAVTGYRREWQTALNKAVKLLTSSRMTPSGFSDDEYETLDMVTGRFIGDQTISDMIAALGSFKIGQKFLALEDWKKKVVDVLPDEQAFFLDYAFKKADETN